MARDVKGLDLDEIEIAALCEWTRSTTAEAGLARRARAMLLLADGESLREVKARTSMSTQHIAKWRDRFIESGVEGLFDAPRSGRPEEIPLETKVKIISMAQMPPPPGVSHWSSYEVAARCGVSPTTVQVLWRSAGLKPHRQESYMASPDPEFYKKAKDVIGLYLNPPEHAVVFCVDEKTAIQALDRLQPLLPLRQGKVERRGFEYERKGVSSLYAALEVGSGEVIGECSPRHRSVDLVRFLDKVVRGRKKQETHIIMDNLSAHKTKLVKDWLAQHGNVRIHYTPTYASWLNQVEIWFSMITTQCIRRGSFSSVADLVKKIGHYIDWYNQRCTPFRWLYNDPTNRINVSRIKNARH
jgi:transposase